MAGQYFIKSSRLYKERSKMSETKQKLILEIKQRLILAALYLGSLAFVYIIISSSCRTTAPLLRPSQPTPTATPWVKQDILILPEAGRGIAIWTDNPQKDMAAINEVEGIINTHITSNSSIYAQIDPRYSKEIVIQEILLLLQNKPYTPRNNDSRRSSSGA